MFRPKKRDEVLAAPTIPSEVHLQSIVILGVAVTSLVGAGWIVASYVIFPNLRSFRHRLIIGLAISDALMALNFLCSTAMNVDGNLIGAPANVGFCSFNGFMTQVFVIQTDYWVLTIAICTYFILAGHKTQSTWVQSHELVVWALPWFFSVLWASVGLGVTGYGDIGAWCWFTSDIVRLLVNFIPRWVIIVTMFALYAYLSYVLYKAHKRLSSIQDASPRYIESGPTTREGSRMTSIHEGIEGRSAVSIRRLKRVARLMLLYPLAYAIIWSLPTAIRIYQATEDKPAAFTLQTIDKASIVIQGFVDAIIYGANETTLASWRARLFR
ncbi:g-protein coupled receptor 1 [Colletotrichum incanum]|uniref:G-protein coupled receptor 1 n=1 Tax=Colletotrichum incanum TaxID=1573173 RepID=A0A167C5Q8_COLIC|nr:g-protein coupled receptor 1 [Colletotrichum incanum]OHW94334.1 G-protein coupled receptor 1 [Colletotrichum incanum]